MAIDPNKAAFLFNNQIDRASVAASSEAAAMPASNLLDPQRTVAWRSAAGGSQSLDITCQDGEEPVGAVAILDHNLTLEGSIRIQAWIDALDGAALVLDQTYQPYEPVRLCGEGLCGEGLCGGFDAFAHGLGLTEGRGILRPILLLFLVATVEARYFRLTFDDAALSYCQAGRVFLGPVFQPDHNFNFGWERRRGGQEGFFVRSRGGQKYGNPGASQAFLRLPFHHLTEDDRNRFWIVAHQLGEQTPFLVCLKPEGGWEQESTTFYVYFSPVAITQGNFAFEQTGLDLEEAL